MASCPLSLPPQIVTSKEVSTSLPLVVFLFLNPGAWSAPDRGSGCAGLLCRGAAQGSVSTAGFACRHQREAKPPFLFPDGRENWLLYRRGNLQGVCLRRTGGEERHRIVPQRAGAVWREAPQGPRSRQRGRHKMPEKQLEMGQRSRFPLETICLPAVFLGFIAAAAGGQAAEPSRVAGSEGR